MNYTNIDGFTNAKVPVSFFKNEQVRFEKNALEELSNFLSLSDTIEKIKDIDKDFFKDLNSRITEVAITPDFHKGAGIPIGTVMLTNGFIVPQAIGNDVNCGMRLYTTDLNEDCIKSNLPSLESKIRHIFFEGGRDIPMNSIQRESMFREGLIGLLETSAFSKDKGIGNFYDPKQQESDIFNVNSLGSMITDKVVGLEDFIGKKELSYDEQIGSIGGGNHFVEIQKVSETLDNKVAKAWGLKKGRLLS
jgi:tRNA-splicing ligase RtcB